ncbi:hypothetical protein BVC80_9101g130 [Macleaya cordata]|uniref:Uncharacterized protein n=1 Tax=Macleaya cordata TaxID=56857 RepID=A0A200QGM7_MACCD|nr:hypothetical protein BVC80_9101g130 [Macleaya cordata]
MAASSCLKLFLAFLLLTILLEGVCTSAKSICELSSLHIDQSKTGELYAGKPVYRVGVANWCACTQSNVVLNCGGFKSVKPIDPQLIELNDDKCLINDGRPFKVHVFEYAADTQYNFTVAKSDPAC